MCVSSNPKDQNFRRSCGWWEREERRVLSLLPPHSTQNISVWLDYTETRPLDSFYRPIFRNSIYWNDCWVGTWNRKWIMWEGTRKTRMKGIWSRRLSSPIMRTTDSNHMRFLDCFTEKLCCMKTVQSREIPRWSCLWDLVTEIRLPFHTFFAFSSLSKGTVKGILSSRRWNPRPFHRKIIEIDRPKKWESPYKNWISATLQTNLWRSRGFEVIFGILW